MESGTPTPVAPAASGTATGGALVALRAASARVAELDETDDHAFDAADHATRFEELHEALSAVLDELDRA